MNEKIKLLIIGAFIFYVGNLIGYKQGLIINENAEKLTKPLESFIVNPAPCSEFADPYIMQKKDKLPQL